MVGECEGERVCDVVLALSIVSAVMLSGISSKRAYACRDGLERVSGEVTNYCLATACGRLDRMCAV